MADDQHVTALDGARAEVLVRAAVPVVDRLGGEEGVEAVDSLQVGRLAPAGPERHRVEAHAAVHPGGGVPGEEVVRQRWQHEALRAEDVGPQAPGGVGGELVEGRAADQVGRHRLGVGSLQGVAHHSGQVLAQVALVDDPVEQPGPGLLVLHRLGQQVVDVEDLDPLLDEGVGERVVFLAGHLHPEDVVEEQVVTVARGEAAELEAGSVQEHPAQGPHLGVDVEGGHRSTFHQPGHWGKGRAAGPRGTFVPVRGARPRQRVDNDDR